MNLSPQIINASLRNRLTEPYFLITASLLCINIAIFHPAVHFQKPNYFLFAKLCLRLLYGRDSKTQRQLWLFSQAALCYTTKLSSRVVAKLHCTWTEVGLSLSLELKFCPIQDFLIRRTPVFRLPQGWPGFKTACHSYKCVVGEMPAFTLFFILSHWPTITLQVRNYFHCIKKKAET